MAADDLVIYNGVSMRRDYAESLKSAQRLAFYRVGGRDIARFGDETNPMVTPGEACVSAAQRRAVNFTSRYRALSNVRAATRSLVIGCVAVIVMLPLILVLPAKFPNLVIPIAYSAAFYYFAKPRFAVDSARGIRFGNDWRHWVSLIGVSIFWLALTMALWMGGLLLLDRVLPGRRPWSS